MSTANIIGNAIFGLRNKSGGNYIDPAVKESLVGLWKFDQNTNESPTRNIIKNKIADRGGDLELLNFAYKANSGYNGYPEDFTSWGSDGVVKEKTSYTFLGKSPVGYDLLVVYMANSSAVESFKVEAKISGRLLYRYYVNDGDSISVAYYELKEGINTLPYSVDSTLIGGKTGFVAKDFASFEIAQLPLYEGALVTDGKDDMIVSQKTVQEMLGGSKEITVVSMIHQIGRVATNTNLFTNCIWANTGSKGCNIVNYQTSLGKTGIYGYSRTNVSVANNEVVINNILGDKADYLTNVSIGALTSNEKFSVVGYLDVSPQQVTSVAAYWTFIADKVLTTDEINQIIAYFKLDKYVTPQVIYDVKRQGLTNDTPAADWYLKDFSGNGHDMQLYNYAKSKDSGIGKYAEDFTTWNKYNNVVVTKDKITVTDKFNQDWLVYKYSKSSSGISPMRIKITGIPINARIEYRYAKTSSDTALSSFDILEDGVYDIPESFIINNEYSVGFKLSVGDWTHIEITQIPDYEGALVSDGKDDYGHADNLPIFKDYTVAIDRAWIGSLDRNQCLATKNPDPNFGAFNFELSEGTNRKTYSFEGLNQNMSFDVDRKISYQSKYSYNGSAIYVGNAVDGKDLFLFRSRSAFPYYAEAAIWSYLLFPYSLSEFLLERQLKKYKLGTLYLNMVEWRPIYSSNVNEYTVTKTTVFGTAGQTDLTIGKHYPIGSQIRFYVKPNGISDEVVSIKVNGVEFTFDYIDSTYGYAFNGTLSDKSPQKINITIDEYIRFDIRFEDIVQPYPYVVKLQSLDGHIYTYGDKLKVGDEIKRGEAINLLPGLYEGRGLTLNGVPITSSEAIITVSKSMVFTANKIWLLDTTEPHAIYSPQKLNIPNSSLKILGYVPDLTGKGNHGKLNNFAYAGMSGANGYKYNWNTWTVVGGSNVERTDSLFTNKLTITGHTWGILPPNNTAVDSFKIKVEGLKTGSIYWNYRIQGEDSNKQFYIYSDGEYELPASISAPSVGFILSPGTNAGVVVRQIGEHEGSICFDGTDDHITIPNIIGGKCVMAKVKINIVSGVIYDQRRANVLNKSWVQLNPNQIAFEQNAVSTYIDGILNHNVTCSDLVSKTVNLTCELEIGDTSGTYQPTIGSSYAVGYTTNINLYEFMLFPEIPSEDEIKKLNNVMGIEENLFLIHLENDDTEIINDTLILNK